MTNLCLAKQHSDQMVCELCGLAWDCNDPHPPTCYEGLGVVERRSRRINAAHTALEILAVLAGLVVFPMVAFVLFAALGG